MQGQLDPIQLMRKIAELEDKIDAMRTISTGGVWKNFNSVPLGTDGSAGSYAETLVYSKYCIIGNLVHIIINRQITNLGSWSGLIFFPPPALSYVYPTNTFLPVSGGVYRYGSTTHSPILSVYWNGLNFLTQQSLGTINGQWSDLLVNDYIICNIIAPI